METSNLLYDGFLKIEKIESVIKGKKVVRERLIMKDSVAAILKNEDNKYCLVRQYRPVVKETLYELPAGICDKSGLSHEEILIEEIEEECEINRSQILSIIEYINYYMAVGFSDAKLYIYEVLVKDVSSDTKFVNDEDVESIEWLTLSEISNYIDSGKIKDNKTILAYNYLLSKSNL